MLKDLFQILIFILNCIFGFSSLSFPVFMYFDTKQCFPTVGNNSTLTLDLALWLALAQVMVRCEIDQKFEICFHSWACLLFPLCHHHEENLLKLATGSRGRKKATWSGTDLPQPNHPTSRQINKLYWNQLTLSCPSDLWK